MHQAARLAICVIWLVWAGPAMAAEVVCQDGDDNHRLEPADWQTFAGVQQLEAVAVLGNPDGSIPIIEFSEYSCPACRAVQPDVNATLERHPDVKLYVVEYPIFGRGWFASGFSNLASRVAVLAARRGRFAEFHAAMFAPEGRFNVQRVYTAAEALGISRAEIKAAAKDDEIEAALDANLAFANEVGISGTPNFIIGSVRFRGWPNAVADCVIEHFRQNPLDLSTASGK